MVRYSGGIGAMALVVASGPAWAGGSLEVGLESVAVRDDLVVSLGFGGPGLHLGGGAATPLGPGQLVVDADLALGVLATRYGQMAVSGAHLLDGRWLIPLSDAVALGPAVVWDGRMTLFDDWDDAHGYWLGSQWIGPAVHVRRPVRDLAVEVDGAVALAGLVGRPEEDRLNKQDPLQRPGFWFGGTARNETFETLASFQAARATVAVGPDRDGGRWQTGADLWLGRAIDPVLTVDFGAALWFGRTWGVR